MAQLRLFIILVSLFALLASSCQKGKRKDSDTLVYSDGLARCEQLAQELEPYGVQINGPSIIGKRNEAELPAALRRTADGESAQVLLERYITISKKLLTLADDKTVNFPERERVQTRMQRAAHYLGQIYADLEWNGQPNPVQTREVDNEEYSVRLARNSKNLNELKDAGLDWETFNQPAVLEKSLNTKTITQLRHLKTLTEDVQNCFIRNKTLSERNNHFDLDGLKVFDDSAISLAAVYYRLGEAIDSEIARKGGKRVK
jgi:hypothetical protein